MAQFQPDIISESMTDNETWNDCPICGKTWKDKVSIPGLIHRTRACDDCKKKLTKEVEGHMWEGRKKKHD